MISSKVTCPHCQAELRLVSEVAGDAPPKDRKFVKIPSFESFRDLCFTLSKHPGCDEKFRSALHDLPQALARYNQLTEGQWKFFSVIHKKLLDSWPPKPEELVAAHAAAPQSFDPDQAPF